MKLTLMVPREVEAYAVRVRAPIRYEEDKAELLGMPGVAADTLDLLIEVDTGRIIGWPGDHTKAYSVHLKVVDQGSYRLTADGLIIHERCQEYVPSWFPGDHYGDYLILDISAEGVVTNWDKYRVQDRLADWVSA
jgi:hypothetical protein